MLVNNLHHRDIKNPEKELLTEIKDQMQHIKISLDGVKIPGIYLIFGIE